MFLEFGTKNHCPSLLQSMCIYWVFGTGSYSTFCVRFEGHKVSRSLVVRPAVCLRVGANPKTCTGLGRQVPNVGSCMKPALTWLKPLRGQ